jgi:hypothetical protein
MFREFLILLHVLCVIYAMGIVLRLDVQTFWCYLKHRKLRVSISEEDHKAIWWGLLAACLTGVTLVSFDTASKGLEVLLNPKLQAKALTVLTLALNGVALQAYVLKASKHPSREFVLKLCTLGSISAVSWLLACFIGLAKSLSGNGLILGVAVSVFVTAALAWAVICNKCNSA